jgi:16S rRNA (cytosine967-C5)-methyltransferase
LNNESSSREKSEPGFEARNLALRALLEVEDQGAYANLLLPSYLQESSLESRDRNFVTELVYGTLRMQILYDQIIEQAAKRKLSKIDAVPRNILRLTAHQLLTLKIPPHAPVDSAVRLTVKNKTGSASGFVNAVSRRISEKNLEQWIDEMREGLTKIEGLALEFAHPLWIVEEYLTGLMDIDAVTAELVENNRNPRVTAVIYPGERWSSESINQSDSCEWVPQARYISGNPQTLMEIRNGTAGIQDQGSYLVTQALHLAAGDMPGYWIDMCAGPGGKAALLSRWAREENRKFTALEISEHRALLMRRVIEELVIADGINPPIAPESASLILLDAPCSGLGALRRRPDARLRKNPSDINSLVSLQRLLLTSSIEMLRPGGVLGYVTCSPLKAETVENRNWVLENFPQIRSMDARQFFPDEMELANHPDVQLWPGIHKTDAMYLALFTKI